MGKERANVVDDSASRESISLKENFDEAKGEITRLQNMLGATEAEKRELQASLEEKETSLTEERKEIARLWNELKMNSKETRELK